VSLGVTLLVASALRGLCSLGLVGGSVAAWCLLGQRLSGCLGEKKGSPGAWLSFRARGARPSGLAGRLPREGSPGRGFQGFDSGLSVRLGVGFSHISLYSRGSYCLVTCA